MISVPNADVACCDCQDKPNPFLASWAIHKESRRSEELPGNNKLEFLAFYFDTPEKVRQGLEDLAWMEAAIDNGAYASPEFFSRANNVFVDQVRAGGPRGSFKEWIGVMVPPGAPGLIAKLKVTLPDGNSYIAPVTLPNRDEKDTEVMVIPFERFFAEMDKRKHALECLASFERKEVEQ